jgi:hypothetical protein
MADVAECIDKLVAAKTISRKVADVNSPVRPEYPQTRVATPCSVFFSIVGENSLQFHAPLWTHSHGFV